LTEPIATSTHAQPKKMILEHEPLVTLILSFLKPCDVFVNMFTTITINPEDSEDYNILTIELKPLWMVCKTWQSIIHSTKFCRFYYHHTMTREENRSEMPDTINFQLQVGMNPYYDPVDDDWSLEYEVGISHFKHLIQSFTWKDAPYQRMVTLRALIPSLQFSSDIPLLDTIELLMDSIGDKGYLKLVKMLKDWNLWFMFSRPREHILKCSSCYLVFKDDGKSFILTVNHNSVAINGKTFTKINSENIEHIPTELISKPLKPKEKVLLVNLFKFLIPKELEAAKREKFGSSKVLTTYKVFEKEQMHRLKEKYWNWTTRELGETIKRMWDELDQRGMAYYEQLQQELEEQHHERYRKCVIEIPGLNKI